MMSPTGAGRGLSSSDAVLLIVGLVVGTGIFKTPSLVAAEAGGASFILALWMLGGLLSLAGALCYAELASAHPDRGGDYHFLARAFGPRLAFLFGWSRLAVLQTGSIALLAFVFGDYAARMFSLGPHSSAVWAALLIVSVTLVQLAGLAQGAALQRVLTGIQLAGLGLLLLGGLAPGTTPAPPPTLGGETAAGAAGLAMVFVMLTFGGWSEAAYLSRDLPNPRSFVKALLLGVALITGLYLLVNAACLRALGPQAMASSDTVLADLGQAVGGKAGLALASLLAAVSAATSTNATLMTGARGVYALGRDFSALNFVGAWDPSRSTPARALLLQSAVALVLVGWGAFAKAGFVAMVEYTAPVFWFFIFLAGVALFVLRYREPDRPRPFEVPLYPLAPLAFCAASAFMCWSSLVYAGSGAWVGVLVLVTGVPVMLAAQPQSQPWRKT